MEDIVHRIIKENTKVAAQTLPYEEALKEGAVSLQGENYDNKVRVITMGDSKELCGGIHVSNTRDIIAFKVVSETGVQSGVRRLTAYTGSRANKWKKLLKDQVTELYEYLKSFYYIDKNEKKKNRDKKLSLDYKQAYVNKSSHKKINIFIDWAKQKDEQIKVFEKQLQSFKPLKRDFAQKEESFIIHSKLTNRLLTLSRQNLELRRYLKISPPKEKEKNNPLLDIFKKKQSQLESLKRKCQSLSPASIDKEALIKKAKSFKSKSCLLVVELPFKDRKPLSAFTDQLKDKLKSGIVVAIGEGSESFPLIVTVTKDLQESFPAGDILQKTIAPFLEGKGGGQPRFAQGVATKRENFQKLEAHLLTELKKTLP